MNFITGNEPRGQKWGIWIKTKIQKDEIGKYIYASKESYYLLSKSPIPTENIAFTRLKVYYDKKGSYVKRYPFGKFYLLTKQL